VVAAVSESFVPVALNTDRLPKDADGDFFRALMKKWPQGLWVVTPEGKTLAFDYHTPDGDKNYKENQTKWLDGTLKLLEDGKAAAGELKAREKRTVNPFPDRGLGQTKDGGVRLAATVVGLRNGKQDGAPAVDSATLTKQEWAAFTPPEKETEWTLPDAAMKKLAVALAPVTDSIYVPRAKDVTAAEVTAKVVRTDGDLTVIKLTGKWESKHLRDGLEKFPITATATGTGVAVFDTKKKEVTSVLLVLTGTYKSGGVTTPTAAVVEWQAENPPE
jgi:hypothetical protein